MLPGTPLAFAGICILQASNNAILEVYSLPNGTSLDAGCGCFVAPFTETEAGVATFIVAGAAAGEVVALRPHKRSSGTDSQAAFPLPTTALKIAARAEVGVTRWNVRNAGKCGG